MIKLINSIAALILTFLLTSVPALAATIYARAIDGTVYYDDSVNGCDKVTADTPADLESALSAAGPGGILYVCEGTYSGLMIDAADGLDSTAEGQAVIGIGEVVIDIDGVLDQAIKVTHNNFIMDNISITGTELLGRYCLYVENAYGEFSNIKIPKTELQGSGLFLDRSSSIFRNCKFTDVGGYHTLQSSSTNSNSPTFDNCVFDGFQIVYIRGGDITGNNPVIIKNCIICGSASTCLSIRDNAVDLLIINSIISGNVSDWKGEHVISNTGGGAVIVKKSLLNTHPVSSADYNFNNIIQQNNISGPAGFESYRYPIYVMVDVDDYASLDYFEQLANLAVGYGWKPGLALSNTLDVTPEDWIKLADYVDKGYDISCHSRYHSDLSDRNAFTITYDGDTATVTIVTDYGSRTGTFSTKVSGGSGNNISPVDLTADNRNTLSELCWYINSLDGYTCSTDYITSHNDRVLTILLDSVSDVDITGSGGSFNINKANYFNEEIVLAKQDIETNIPGYSCNMFTFPYALYDDDSRSAVKNAGFLGARTGSGYKGAWQIDFDETDVFNLATRFVDLLLSDSDNESAIFTLLDDIGISGRSCSVYVHNSDEYAIAEWKFFFDILQKMGGSVISTADLVKQFRHQKTTVFPEGTMISDEDGSSIYQYSWPEANYALAADSICIGAGSRADAINYVGSKTDYFGNNYFYYPYDALSIGIQQSIPSSVLEQSYRSFGATIYP
jgi:hypothetical protein